MPKRLKGREKAVETLLKVGEKAAEKAVKGGEKEAENDAAVGLAMTRRGNF